MQGLQLLATSLPSRDEELSEGAGGGVSKGLVLKLQVPSTLHKTKVPSAVQRMG